MSNTRFLHNVEVEHVNPLSGKKTRTQGTLVALRVGDTIRFGSSICSVKDQYSRTKGREEALKRASCGVVQPDYKGNPALKQFITNSMLSFGSTKTAANKVNKNLRVLWSAMEEAQAKL